MTVDPLQPVQIKLEELGESLPGEAHDQLLAFAALIDESNVRYGLISPGDRLRVVSRHFVESASFLRWIPPGDLRVLDFGSGAGLPGIVIQILRPASHVVLLESRHRKQVFLRHAVRSLRLAGASVAGQVAELPDVKRASFDRVTARGVAPLESLVGLAAPLFVRGGLLLVAKGSRGLEEISGAARRLSEERLEWIEHRIDSLTTREGESIGGSTFVFRKG